MCWGPRQTGGDFRIGLRTPLREPLGRVARAAILRLLGQRRGGGLYLPLVAGIGAILGTPTPSGLDSGREGRRHFRRSARGLVPWPSSSLATWILVIAFSCYVSPAV